MVKILNVQLSIFTNKNIAVSSKNIIFFMEEIKKITNREILPNTINTQNLNVTTGEIETISNLSFVSIDAAVQIANSNNRIDCTFNCEKEKDVDVIFKMSTEILQVIMEKEKISSNRLALNVTYLRNICGENSKFETEIIKLTPFYKDLEIKEWSSRVNGRKTIQISAENEELNVITDYRKEIHPINEEIRIVCHSDINTLAENQGFRFEDKAVEEFFEVVKGLLKQLLDDIEGMA